jgi:hypothetical protein
MVFGKISNNDSQEKKRQNKKLEHMSALSLYKKEGRHIIRYAAPRYGRKEKDTRHPHESRRIQKHIFDTRQGFFRHLLFPFFRNFTP